MTKLIAGVAFLVAAGIFADERPDVTLERITFDSNKTGTTPSGWAEVNSDESYGPNWRVLASLDAPSEPNVLAETVFDREPAGTPKLIHQRRNFRDGSIGVRIKPMGSPDRQRAGLVWRYQNEQNFFTLNLNWTDGSVQLLRYQAGRSTVIESGVQAAGQNVQSPDLLPERWVHVEIGFEGPKLTVLVNGRPRIEAVDTIAGWPGKAGLWSGGFSLTHFDDFSIRVTR